MQGTRAEKAEAVPLTLAVQDKLTAEGEVNFKLLSLHSTQQTNRNTSLRSREPTIHTFLILTFVKSKIVFNIGIGTVADACEREVDFLYGVDGYEGRQFLKP